MTGPRVLFCALETYSLIGGLQNFNRRIIRHLGFFACSGEVSKARVLLLRDRPEDIPSIPGVRFHAAGDSRKTMIATLLRWLGKTDILLLGHVNLLPLAALARLRKPSMPIILFTHGDEVWNMPEYRLKRWYEPSLLKAVTRIASVSDYTAKIMAREFCVSENKFRLFPNAVDGAAASFCARAEVPTVLSVTRLGAGDRQKNIHQSLRAFALARQHLPNARYEIIGDGVMRPELEALAQTLNLGASVSFMGWVDEATLKGAYARADAFLLPSAKEGFGIVYLEAWLHKVPVICSLSGASHEIVSDGVDGYAVDENNIAQLAECLIALLGDPDKAKAFGQAGFRKTQEHYLDAAFRQRFRALLRFD